MKLHPAACRCFDCWCNRHPQAAEFLIDLTLMVGVAAGAWWAFNVEISIR